MDSKAVPSSTDIAYKTAKENHDAAVIALAKATVALNGDPLATPIITGAIADETSAKSAWQGAIAALPIVIDSYTRQTPLDQQAIAYLSTQIDDLTQRIAAQTQILAQEKVVVDYWLAQIKIALKD